MLSARAAVGVASLIVPMVLSAAAQNAASARDRQEQSQVRAQAPTPGNQVEVINGASRTLQELDEQQSVGGSGTAGGAVSGYVGRRLAEVHSMQSVHGKAVKSDAATPQSADVEILNGSRIEMRSFEGIVEDPSLTERERQRRQKVVVAVASAESARKLGNARPVVTSVATSESERRRGNTTPIVVLVASSESSRDNVDAAPVVFLIAPSHAKRPPYHPSTADSQ